MSNSALRKIFNILIEKLARLDIIYESKLVIEDEANIKFINTCRETLRVVKDELASAIEKQDHLEKSLLIYKQCMDKFLEMHSLLAHFPANVIASETYIFLSEVLKTRSSFNDFDSRIVMLTQDFLTRNTHKFTSNLPFASDLEKKPLALYIPMLQSANPLYWPILVKNAYANADNIRIITKKHFNDLIGSKTEFPEEQRKIAEKLTYSLMSDLFSLRILGPAYYYLFAELGVFRSIAETKSRLWPTLAVREELLYGELVRLNLADKARDTHSWFVELSELSDDLHTTLGFKVGLDRMREQFNTLVQKLNNEIENVVDEKILFTENDFAVSKAAVEKLKYGILIASSQKDDNSGEIPNTPQQIINAGWLYREERGDKIANLIMQNNKTDYSPYIEDIKKLDSLLISSIEKSRLIDIFLDED